MKAQDALYAEAEQVYRTYQAEFLKVIRAGGADKLTPGLQAVIGSKEVEQDILDQLVNFKARQLELDGAGATIKSATRKPTITKSGSVVAMSFCIDSTGSKILRKGKVVSRGIIGDETVFFGEVGKSLRMVAMESEERESCEG
ncbi:hypothetical protein [Micropruina sp.]|uniref:hypothetical protein n=1 Tax=Micropruina sp. TaxID=2737536 RepID=UPI0039E4BA70